MDMDEITVTVDGVAVTLAGGEITSPLTVRQAIALGVAGTMGYVEGVPAKGHNHLSVSRGEITRYVVGLGGPYCSWRPGDDLRGKRISEHLQSCLTAWKHNELLDPGATPENGGALARAVARALLDPDVIETLVIVEGGCAEAAQALRERGSCRHLALDVVEGAVRDALAGRYSISDGTDRWTVEADSMEDALDQAATSGDCYDVEQQSIHICYRVTELATDETAERECDYHPFAPDCYGGRQRIHRWVRPVAVVGGCETNPGVEGSAHGGVVERTVCAACGLMRIEDSGATSPQNGQRCTTVDYIPLGGSDHEEAWEAWRTGDAEGAAGGAL